MERTLAELIDLLALEKIEENLFRGASQDLGWGRVFGGQVLGQALSAAAQTAPAERAAHSLHAYFLRPGDPTIPVVYTVDRIRDGRSFTTRRVVAVQKGEAILNLAASFQLEEPGFDHSDPAPEAPAPEALRSERDLALRIFERIPPALRAMATAERPVEIRPVAPVNPLRPDVRAPRRQVWLRSSDRLPDDPRYHQFLLAYASDFNFLTTAAQPHGISWLTPGIQVASVDHAMWFHRPFRFDDWLLYDIESPSASGARAVVRGRIYSRDGRLVATTAQEGLMRDRRGR